MIEGSASSISIGISRGSIGYSSGDYISLPISYEGVRS